MNGATVAVALNTIDRYLSQISTEKNILNLLAMSSIFIASKLQDPNPILMVRPRVVVLCSACTAVKLVQRRRRCVAACGGGGVGCA